MRRALAGALLALSLIACRGEPARSESGAAGRPTLNLLTSLPLVFGEGFSLETAKHPLIARLEHDFEVRLVDGPEQLPKGGLLLAVQPQALTADRLVGLDQWVRSGGRMVLLADPRFTWESSRPLGDRFRPPFAFPDTGLLQHWGLDLTTAEDGPALRKLGHDEILTASPGRLEAERDAPCRVSADAFMARCSLGAGEALIVADADFVQAGLPGGVGGPTERNQLALRAQLKALSRR